MSDKQFFKNVHEPENKILTKANVVRVTADDAYVLDGEYKTSDQYQAPTEEIGEEIQNNFDLEAGFKNVKLAKIIEESISNKDHDRRTSRNDDKRKKFGYSRN